jgi:transcriptional regulator with XRE-family HTH domain
MNELSDGSDHRDQLADGVQRALAALSERIAVLRGEANMTQRELAERADWSQSNLSKLERGKHRPGIDVVLRLQYALRLDSVESLFGEIENPETPSARLLGVRSDNPGIAAGALTES